MAILARVFRPPGVLARVLQRHDSAAIPAGIADAARVVARTRCRLHQRRVRGGRGVSDPPRAARNRPRLQPRRVAHAPCPVRRRSRGRGHVDRGRRGGHGLCRRRRRVSAGVLNARAEPVAVAVVIFGAGLAASRGGRPLRGVPRRGSGRPGPGSARRWRGRLCAGGGVSARGERPGASRPRGGGSGGPVDGGVEVDGAGAPARRDGPLVRAGDGQAVLAQALDVQREACSMRRKALSRVLPVATHPGRSGTDAPQSLCGSRLMRTRYGCRFMVWRPSSPPGV
jgi:hypothetical protein